MTPIPAQIKTVDPNIPLMANSSLISFTLFQIMTCKNRKRVLMFMNDMGMMDEPMYNLNIKVLKLW